MLCEEMTLDAINSHDSQSAVFKERPMFVSTWEKVPVTLNEEGP